MGKGNLFLVYIFCEKNELFVSKRCEWDFEKRLIVFYYRYLEECKLLDKW